MHKISSSGKTTLSYLIVKNMCRRSQKVLFARTWSSITLKVEIALFDYYENREENISVGYLEARGHVN